MLFALFYYPLIYGIAMGLMSVLFGSSFLETYSSNFTKTNHLRHLITISLVLAISELFVSDKRLDEYEKNCNSVIKSKTDLNQLKSWFEETRPKINLRIKPNSIEYKANLSNLTFIEKLHSENGINTYKIEAKPDPIFLFSNRLSEDNCHEVSRITDLLKT